MYGSLQILTRTAPPWLPIRKSPLPGQAKASIRVCGDYSVTVNSQLEDHRQPIPFPEDLMRKLGRGYCFSKIDLANAYNQICLSPDSQKKLALSTHKGVLLQKIMEQLTQNLRGVALYFDDILVSGDNAKDHLMNLRALFKRLEEKVFAATVKNVFSPKYQLITWVTLYQVEEFQKGPKVDAILEMPTPKNISTLKYSLASVQFYSKFLPPYFSEIKDNSGSGVKKKRHLSERSNGYYAQDTVLAHYDHLIGDTKTLQANTERSTILSVRFEEISSVSVRS